MPPFLLAFIPTLVKAVLNIRREDGSDMPRLAKIKDAIGVSLNPLKNKKTIVAALLTLLSTYDITVSNEWLALIMAVLPYIGAVFTGLFAIGKAK